MRYSQLRRFEWRGAVNAVPDNCSAYSPSALCCGEFCPCGNASRAASVANSLPKPDMYRSRSGLAGANSRNGTTLSLAAFIGSEHAALHLFALDRFEQRLEIAFAEAEIALALDDLEEDRTEHVLREDLQ